jgi:outer membrane protein insertion porin family
MKSVTILLKSIFIIFLFLSSKAFSDTINKIEIIGNDRISDETIKLFISVNIKDEINEVKLNNIVKDLYDTNFFKDISVNFDNQILSIKVLENPIIENISYEGVKSNRILDFIKQGTTIKQRSSYNEIEIKKEKQKIENILKNLGYYNSSLNILVEQSKNNLVNIVYDINLGKKIKNKKNNFYWKQSF